MENCETRGGEEAKPAQPREKCGHRIKGKNTTNLKRHLKTFHKEIQIAHVKEPPKKDKPKPTSAGDFFGSSYKLNSPEQQSKEVAVAAWIGRTALPARTVEDEDFIMMMGKIDKRFTVPKKTKVSNLVNEAYVEQQEKFRHRLSVARKVTLGLDIWTKKGLTASFIAISACYFNPEDNKAEHILLNLKEMVHPHTAQAISALVEESIEAWGIPKEKILTTITDNGSNMVAAFPFHTAEEATTSEDSELDSDSEHSEDGDENNNNVLQEGEDDRYDYGTMERTPCVVHTLQLVVNMLLNKEPSIRRLLDKTRHLVNQFRKSSVATERLLQRSALVLIKDCPTRWSSCYSMMARCLQLKDHVTAVAESMGWDSLQPSEWQKIGMLRDLLLPFAEHTKLLQSDTQSLSLVVPALLDLRNHLSEFSLAYARTYRDAASLAQKMLSNMERRFSVFLDVTAAKFSPLAAAACFVDPSVSAETLIENDDEGMQDLLRKAEDYIAHCVPRRVEVRVEQVTDDEEPENVDREAPAETTPQSGLGSSSSVPVVQQGQRRP
ncbi:hypothetical protein AAFF_G00040660 [Aldrovandia affinis]|uniref:Uncharacterized protein n=1 Tax=Aldrovandia affinis TaxID=143900 RepID=A0AAD7S2V7_9TELE|nr:hypothetical protein AAFF_G00040660 [Aldrovandia affinis]